MQRVLIVDDSKTAQIRLKKMLARYELIVDIAFSAEEALGYLSYRMPAVIFMDHHMEGMDGFEALKIIKANPNTAMIPVIMYTAQKGDVYVGQARALGALDILSKEVIKPASIERVLSSLRITPTDNAAIEADSQAKPVPAVATLNQAQAGVATQNGVATKGTISPRTKQPSKATLQNPTKTIQTPSESANEEPALEQIRSQVARLFEMHIADVRQQIADNSRLIVRRLTSEIEKNSHKEATVGDIPLSVVNAEMNADSRKAGFVSSSLLLLILMGLGLMTYELFENRQALSKLGEEYGELLNMNQQNQQLIGDLTKSLSGQQKVVANDERNTGLMEALSWALDIDMQFDYGAQPLDEQQMLKVSNLVYRLASAGFNGSVELDIHFGNYCLQANDAGNWGLADAAMPAEDCMLLSDLNPEFPTNDYLSIPYLNFEQNAVPIKNGSVDLNVGTSGLSKPRYEYPQITPGMSAGSWNAMAAKNNRVSILFSY